MIYLDYFFWYLLVITGLVFIFSGLDDLFFDIFYWTDVLVGKLSGRESNIISYEELTSIPEKRIALIVGCWQESAVIEHMVRYNILNVDYVNFDIFVGVYPNDPDTVEKAKTLETEYDNVHCVVNPRNGPTNKADNLNTIYAYIENLEKKINDRFAIVLMHDPEDVIHYLSFRVHNYLIPKSPMVQIPILPIDTPLDNFTYWSYCDEFAELHTKDMCVREKVNGFVPSAGVGTGFDRDILEIMAAEKNGAPFGTTTFTEDYSTSYQLHLMLQKKNYQKKPVFSFRYVERIQSVRPWYYFGKRELKKIKTLVATRALFPVNYFAAVRQRSRWTLGIVFQEWKSSGWHGNLSTLYFVFHDRKGVFAHFFSGIAYVVFLYWTVIFIYSYFYEYTITLDYFLKLNPWMWVIISIVTVLMLNRMLQRAIATTRIYGFLPGLLSIPRIFVSNVINMHSFSKAFMQFYTGKKAPQKVKWSKTTNNFPLKEQLGSYGRRLGDVLLQKNMISKKDLVDALEDQKVSKKKLGTILVERNLISEEDIQIALSRLYNIESRHVDKKDILTREATPMLSNEAYAWLIENYFRPIGYSKEHNALSIAISNPEEDFSKLEKLNNMIYPVKAKFFLAQWGAPKTPL